MDNSIVFFIVARFLQAHSLGFFKMLIVLIQKLIFIIFQVVYDYFWRGKKYLKYLGTTEISPSQKQEEFYKIGCEMNVSCNTEKIKISLNGLNENFEKAVTLTEDVLANAIADEDALANLKMDMLKKRADAKLNKQTILFRAMGAYAKYGENSSFTNVLSDEEIENTTAQQLVDIIHSLTKDEHRILYYGPSSLSNLNENLSNLHKNTTALNPIAENNKFEELEINTNTVYVLDYDMKQAEVLF